jgi:pimeloyl-ACP methyl ester carboxylesterase
MSGSLKREILSLSDGDQLKYSLYREADAIDYPSPLLICLHPGWDGLFPSPHYGEQFLSMIFISAFAESGATIVSPDCPSGSWNNPKSKKALLELLDHLMIQSDINPDQVSLVGYSAGGWGVWYTLLDSADRFSSAIVFATLPVIDPVDRLEDNFPKCTELIKNRLDEWIGKLPPFPIYMIHSKNDELFPYTYVHTVYQALFEDERQINLDIIDGVGHFDGSGYIAPLQKTMPWLQDTWKSLT